MSFALSPSLSLSSLGGSVRPFGRVGRSRGVNLAWVLGYESLDVASSADGRRPSSDHVRLLPRTRTRHRQYHLPPVRAVHPFGLEAPDAVRTDPDPSVRPPVTAAKRAYCAVLAVRACCAKEREGGGGGGHHDMTAWMEHGDNPYELRIMHSTNVRLAMERLQLEATLASDWTGSTDEGCRPSLDILQNTTYLSCSLSLYPVSACHSVYSVVVQ